MKPTVGKIVLYTNLGDKDGRYPPEQQAAIITKVQTRVTTQSMSTPEMDPYVVSLTIFYATGVFMMQDVPFSEAYERGHWSWPVRE